MLQMSPPQQQTADNSRTVQQSIDQQQPIDQHNTVGIDPFDVASENLQVQRSSTSKRKSDKVTPRSSNRKIQEKLKDMEHAIDHRVQHTEDAMVVPSKKLSKKKKKKMTHREVSLLRMPVTPPKNTTNNYNAPSRMYSVAPKEYPCTICGAVFFYSSHLNGHKIAIHTGKYRHRCQHCKKGFIYPGQKEKHEKLCG